MGVIEIILGILFTVVIVIPVMVTLVKIAAWVLNYVGAWKMLGKMGEKGWKCLIPLYNDYLVYKHAWQTKYFWLWLVSDVLYYTFKDSDIMALTIFCIVMGIISLIVNFRFCMNLARSFGKGKGTGWLTFFFTDIMSMYFGLSKKCPYVGNGSELPQDK